MTQELDPLCILEDAWPNLETLDDENVGRLTRVCVDMNRHDTMRFALACALYTILNDRCKVQTLQRCATNGCENRFSGEKGRSVRWGGKQHCTECAENKICVDEVFKP